MPTVTLFIQLKYLVSIIIIDGRSEKEIQNRVGQEKEAFLVNYKLLTSQNIDLSKSKKMFN